MDMRMTNIQRTLDNLLLLVAGTFLLSTISGNVNAATAEDLNREASHALQNLYKTNPVAESISKKARAVLVFPNIVKAGLVCLYRLKPAHG